MRQEVNDALQSEDLDVLQEIMNIAFGKATANLAELIDIYVNLSVPYVRIINTNDLSAYIREEVSGLNNVSTVEQKFWGGLKGTALLVFPTGAGRELIDLLTGENAEAFECDPLDELEKGTLMEVGNILIGACVGKIAELLNDCLVYSPPVVHVGQVSARMLPQDLIDSFDLTIALKTSFSFEAKDVVGFLFIMTRQESMEWLRPALGQFVEQYS
jgi:chemotaxis protein CheC